MTTDRTYISTTAALYAESIGRHCYTVFVEFDRELPGGATRHVATAYATFQDVASASEYAESIELMEGDWYTVRSTEDGREVSAPAAH